MRTDVFRIQASVLVKFSPIRADPKLTIFIGRDEIHLSVDRSIYIHIYQYKCMYQICHHVVSLTTLLRDHEQQFPFPADPSALFRSLVYTLRHNMPEAPINDSGR